MPGKILLVLLLALLVAALPAWGYSRRWGYVPAGLVALALIAVTILLVTGRI